MRFRIRGLDEQIADEMRRRIAVGEWAAEIPGLHRLTAEFGAGRVAVERALALLTASGEIVPGKRGLPMRAGKPGGIALLPGSMIAYDLPADVIAGPIPATIGLLTEKLPQPVRLVRFESREGTADRMRRLRDSRLTHMVLLALEPELADTLHAEGHRVVAVGARGEPRLAPLVTSDYGRTIRKAFERAFAAGHRRVTFPLWRKSPETVARIRTCIAAAYSAANLRHNPAFDAPVVEDESPEAMHACIVELFRTTPPTALVLNDFSQWLAVGSTLGGLRIPVPSGVSTILLTHVPALDVVSPTQACFAFPARRCAATALRLLKSDPAAARRIVRLDTIPIEGASLGPPKPSVR